MKAMHYDFENVGGLLQVIAVPPASFVQIRKDYAAGLNYLELRNREDIVSYRYMPMTPIPIMRTRR